MEKHAFQEGFYMSKNFLPYMKQADLRQVELARVSSKGQLVIPMDIRSRMKIKEGDFFATTSESDVIILKRIKDPILREDLEILHDAEQAWKEIESGKSKTMDKKDFLKELEKW